MTDQPSKGNGSRDLTATVRWGDAFAMRGGVLMLSADVLTLVSGETVEFQSTTDRLENVEWRGLATSLRVSVDDRRFSIGFIPKGSDLSGWYGGIVAGRGFRAALAGDPLPAHGPIWAIATMWTLSALMLIASFGFAMVLLGNALDPTSSSGIRILSGIMALLMAVHMVLRLVLAVRKFFKFE